MIEPALLALGGFWTTWALLCWFSPYAIARHRRTPALFTIPRRLANVLNAERIWLYEADDLGLFGGYAFSARLGFRRVIVLNATFWRFAAPSARDFLLAHEIGHHVKGHVTARLLANIFFLGSLAPVRRWLQLTEHEADRYAEEFTGYTAAVLWGPVVVSEAGGSGQTEERQA